MFDVDFPWDQLRDYIQDLGRFDYFKAQQLESRNAEHVPRSHPEGVFRKLLVGLLAKMCQQKSKMLRTGGLIFTQHVVFGGTDIEKKTVYSKFGSLSFGTFVINPGEPQERRIPDDLRKFGSWLQRGCELQPQAKQGQTKFECLLCFSFFLAARNPPPGGWASTRGQSNLNYFSNFIMLFLKCSCFVADLASCEVLQIQTFPFKPPTRWYIWRISWRLDSRSPRSSWKSDVWCFAQVVKNHKGPHPSSERSSLKHPQNGMGST